MKLVEKLKGRVEARPTIDVAISEIVQEPLDGSFKIRALTVGEKSDSAEAALLTRKRLMRDLPETHARALVEDGEFLDDVKQVERLWRACRDAEDAREPAFPSADFIRSNFTAAEIVRITQWYDRAERENAKTPDIVTIEQRMSLVNACAMVENTEHADRIVDGLPKWMLARLFVWLSAEHVRLLTKSDGESFQFAPDNQ